MLALSFCFLFYSLQDDEALNRWKAQLLAGAAPST